jgi:hypothetical protein
VKGFQMFFKSLIEEKGEQECKLALMRWGFDKDQYPLEVRTFGFTIQSLNPIELSI